MNFSERLKKERQKKGWSQAELAELEGLPKVAANFLPLMLIW